MSAMPGAIPDTITECAALIRDRQLTVSDLVDQVLAIADATEPSVHAFAYLDQGQVRAAALRADGELSHGKYRGPLHGIPIGIKDVLITADMPTKAGSLALDDVPSGDARVVELLRQAGAIIMGKHVTHEFATGQNVPETRNPWNLDCYPGGSSAGGGVSVAVGSSLAAIGTDAGGSVRKPAALNGVVGLKPTLGRLSRRGVLQPSGSMDHVGLITRSVRDLPLLMTALAVRDPEDDTLVDAQVPPYVVPPIGGLAGARIGICDYFGGSNCSPEIAEAFETAVATLRDAGAIIVPISLPSLEFSLVAGEVISQAEGGAAHIELVNQAGDSYGEPTRRYLQIGALIPPDYQRIARRARVAIRDEVRRGYESHSLDALVTPTTALVAMPLQEMIIGRDLARYVRFTIVANLTGQPAVTVPSGFAAGMPTGLQFIGRPFDEAGLFSLALDYETRTPWWTCRPPLSDPNGGQ
jgi:aspartyl-tRNA(Asn)/glutamyl-tRNA(Gln) amidotransferase subunit A